MPYSNASCAATKTCPLLFMMFVSFASAATTRPINCGDSELLISKCLALRITDSVRTKPGYNATTATLNFSNSCAMYSDILSTAALETPYWVLPKYTCADQNEIFTIKPLFFFVISRAANADEVYAARTPASNIASQRQKGCSQNGLR